MPHPTIRSILVSLTIVGLSMPTAFAQTTERVSVDSAGVQGNSGCRGTSIATDGNFVAFGSYASNLVFGDTNGCIDIFIRDLQADQTSLISLNSAGVQGNDCSDRPSISASGRYVAFDSYATNLVPGDTNQWLDVFVHDRQTGLTTRVSLGSAGAQGNGESWYPSISAEGRFVAFQSNAFNLVSGDTNGTADVFVHDRQTGQTRLISVDSAGGQGDALSIQPAISADGIHIAFTSFATNLVPADLNGAPDVFVHHSPTGQTLRVSVDSAGGEGNARSWYPSISADGRYVAFDADATDLVPGDTNNAQDNFFHDRQTGQTSRVSVDSAGAQANHHSYRVCISPDGRFLSFSSNASNLVPGDANGFEDVFVHERVSGQTSLVSLSLAGVPGNSRSFSEPGSSISADGRYVIFLSYATDLVIGDTNSNADAFVRDRTGSGLTLAKFGSCPGATTLTVNNATANGTVAIVYGPAGVFVKPTPPCQGLTLGVSPPSLGAVRTADAAGVATLNFNAPPGACGRSVQAVDVTTCVATNVIVL